ncbi:S8 family serine peptidase [Crossiella sp. NPDC003009]
MRHDLTVHGPGHGLSYTTPAQSIAEPASSPWALAVGAITPANQQSGGPVEGYSSRGPTIDGRVKPDLTAFTNVSTHSAGSAPGATAGGTSISAAHVAGAAAVYRGNGTLDPSHLEAQLLDAAGRQGRAHTLGRGVLHLGSPRPLNPPAGHGYTPIPVQQRVLNTHTPVGGHQRLLEPGETFTLPVPNLPPDAAAVVLTVTGMNAEEVTSISVRPDLTEPSSPLSTVDVRKGQNRSETVTTLLHPVDKVIRLHSSSGRVHVAVDLLGYYSSGGASTFFPMSKTVRLHQGFPPEAGGQLGLALRGVQGISATATAAAVNVTTLTARWSWPHPGRSGSGQATHPAGPGAGRQSVWLPCQP